MKQNLLLTIALTCLSFAVLAQDPWPKDVEVADGSEITMYEPQPESLDGNQLQGRAAVSLKETGKDEPVFGAIFFTATLDNAKNGETPRFTSMRVTNAKFSGIEDNAQVDKYTALLEKNAPGWSLGMTAGELNEAIARENGAANGEKFNNAPPEIIYSNTPATLVVLDGKPIIVHDKDLDADKVANSPNILFKEGRQWNLYAGGNWYKSASVTEGWKINNDLSAKVKTVNEAIKKQEKENNNGTELPVEPKATEIIVATQPTELIQTDGEPVYKSVAETSLLYVSNSPNELFKDINSQKTYLLIAGRWYQSPDLNGPWSYVPADKLPEDFAAIPERSDKSNVLSNVAGTEAAEEAKLDAAVPQTARVDRRTATVNVEYDGAPVFNRIEGTSLQLAENSNVTVMIDASGNYFALDNGVWFISDDAYGPWAVANDRPRDIDDIPASNRAYNTKYVYIYDVSPDYVYTGYTAGYLGSYYYGPTIVYGTGYHYHPWYRTVYFARPITWGFGFLYDPWNGWNINLGYNFGFVYVGFNYGYGYGYGGGWFGPYNYCPPYRRPYWYGGYYAGRHSYYGRSRYYDRNYYGYNNRYSRGGVATRPTQNIRPRSTGWTTNRNLYNNQRGVVAQNTSARTPRLYRPTTGTSNVNAPVNERINRRVPSNTNRSTEYNNSNSRVDNDNNNGRISSGNNSNPRRPAIQNPSSTSGSRPAPVERRTRENPARVEQPERRAPERVETPSRSSSAPVERRTRQSPVQRPVENTRPSAPVQRQSRPDPVQRQSRPAPVQRQSAPPRQSAPRPSVSNRSSAPQGGSSSRPAPSRGARHDRR